MTQIAGSIIVVRTICMLIWRKVRNKAVYISNINKRSNSSPDTHHTVQLLTAREIKYLLHYNCSQEIRTTRVMYLKSFQNKKCIKVYYGSRQIPLLNTKKYIFKASHNTEDKNHTRTDAERQLRLRTLPLSLKNTHRDTKITTTQLQKDR